MRPHGFVSSGRDANNDVTFLVYCEQFRVPKLFRVCRLRFGTQDFVDFCCSIEGECIVCSRSYENKPSFPSSSQARCQPDSVNGSGLHLDSPRQTPKKKRASQQASRKTDCPRGE